jgi:shikimate kinase
MNTSSTFPRIALTGFMGVGKSTVSRHLARLLKSKHIDLDDVIEAAQRKSIAELVDKEGIETFRQIETEQLGLVLKDPEKTIISLGGGAFVTEKNRQLIKAQGVTSIWLEATFEHCWTNISLSYKERPLARNRSKAQLLFEERNRFYCLADWHFLIMSGCNSYDVAEQIAEQVFGLSVG